MMKRVRVMKEQQPFHWTGRIDDPQLVAHRRVHQAIRDEGLFALMGFNCDEGVRRNAGRLGAKDGPKAIREALSSMPWRTIDGLFIQDVGDIECEGTDMEAAQQTLGNEVEKAFEQGKMPIIFGGGHETFYGHYLGVRQYLGADQTIGIINIDAHFDLRSYDDQSSSGTMFRQILEQDDHARYLVLGIQRYGNTEALFQTADELGCQYVLEDELRLTDIQQYIDQFAAKHDALIVTLCMDVLHQSAAPGVSAPSPFGLSPKTIRHLLRTIMAHPKACSFDVCEVNPSLDIDHRTAKLAASFALEVMMVKSSS